MQYKAMSTRKSAQSTNAAASNSAKAKLTPSSSTSNEKFSAAGQPAGTTSASMLGETRYNPNATNTVPFETLPPFPKKNKMDNDERSSISDTDDAVLANDDKSKCSPDAAKKTRGRVRIQMEYIQNKLRRYTTFSKRKSGIMKKAYELSTLTGTQVMLLVASETGHVYTFATPKLQPMITSEAGKALIQTCLHQPDPPAAVSLPTGGEYDVRMSAAGYEETELSYGGLPEEESFKNGLENVLPASTSAQMPTVLNPGPIVTIPHGMMQMPTFATAASIPETHMVAMNPIMAHSHHPMAPVQQLTCSPQSMSPHHSPPPSYSPHQQPTSPPRTYPGSPSAVPYSQSSHVPHQPVMMDELGSPSHMSKSPDHYLGHYDRSPSRSPIQHRYNSPHHTSPQNLYSAPSGSPPMGGHHSPPMRI